MRHEHTDQCQRQHIFFQVERARYKTRWPNYCRTCKGEGFTWYTYDPSPVGVALSPGTMEDCDPCPDCIEKGICPRCGEQVWTEEAWDSGEPVVCSACRWEEERPDSLPPEAECYCWVEWERKEVADFAAWHDGVPMAEMVEA